MKLVVKNNTGQKFTLQIRPNETFLDLKRRVELESGISLDLRDITSNKRNINEQRKVIDYFLNEQNIQNEQEPEPVPVEVFCAVPTCDNKKSQNPNKTYFEFPDDVVRCHQWVLYIRRIAARLSPENPRAKLPVNVGVPGTAICSDHFKDDQFVKNTTTLLKRTAVPCVNPELPSAIEVATSHRSAYEPKRSAHGRFSQYPKVKSQNILHDSMSSGQQSQTPSLFGASPAFLTCRLCANPSRHTVFIYSKEGKNMMLAEKICSTLPIRVKMTDRLPKQVCRACIDKLNAAFYLMERATVTDDNFRANDKKRKAAGVEKEPPTKCPCCFESEFRVVAADSPENEEVGFSDMLPGEPAQLTEPGPVEGCEDGEESSHQINTEDSEQGEYILSDILDLDGSMKGEEVYLCRLCGASLVSQDGAVDHALSHGSEEFFPCISCESFYPNPQELVDHFLTHCVSDSTPEPGVFCEKCGENFTSVLAFSDHRCDEEAAEPIHKCSLCLQTFTSDHRLQFHMKFHIGVLKGDCPNCDESFPSEWKLYRHMVDEHPDYDSGYDPEQNSAIVDEEIQCDECGQFFLSLAALKTHIKGHVKGETPARPFPCEMCGKSFLRRSMLRNHVNTTHKQMQEGSCFTCKICKEAFASTNQGVLHMDSAHNHYVECEPAYSFEMLTVSRLYQCEYCEKVYAESSVLNKHRETAHPPNSACPSFVCKFCETTFNTYSDLQDHKTADHNQLGVPDEYKGENLNVPITFLCEFCERVFVNYVKYTEHQTIHFGPEPYVCRICGLKFGSLGQVNEHRSVHGDVEPLDEVDLNRPFDCHYCSKSFAIEDALVKHIRMHTGEKPFICEICGKGFSQSSGLNTHKKVHSDERPFSCHLCPRTFKIKGDRDVHIRKHSGQRPFKCEFCLKAFMTQHVYSQHRKIHTGERPYRCDVCHVAFRRSHVLTVHKRIHTGEKPNLCDICGKRYRQKGDMLKHKRSQHGFPRETDAKALLVDATAAVSEPHFMTLKSDMLEPVAFQ